MVLWLLLLLLVLILLLAGPGAVLLLGLVPSSAEQLRRRRGSGDLHHDVGGLANDLGLESLLWISRVLDGADEAIGVHHRVATLDHRTVANLLAVLVVGKLVVLHIESKLIRGVLLKNIVS